MKKNDSNSSYEQNQARDVEITQYDDIAQEYRESKLLPWRDHVEKYTLMQLAGSIEGQQVIDLACGEGHFTRLLKQKGVASILGVDASKAMIELALAEEDRRPLDIEYCVQDVCDLKTNGKYDLAFAAWLLNYATDARQLLRMGQAIAGLLKPGGRFVTINTNPDDPISNFQMGKPHGFTKHTIVPDQDGCVTPEGTPVVWKLFLPNGKQIEITNYHLKKTTVTDTLLESGFREVNWHAPQVSPVAIQTDGYDHWKPFVDSPPFVFLECHT
ncbi:MAG: class I SAM-dependent DNA methyltransferase [Rubripirellula sp.]